MFGNFALNSRLVVVTCAAAALLIMCLPAAGAASPQMATGYIRIKNNFLTRLNAPHSQQTPVSAALPSKESGVQTATDTRGNSRDVNHRSHPVPYTQGGFSFGQNSQDSSRPRVRITKVQSGGGKLASNAFTRSSLHGGSEWRSRKHDYSVPQKGENTGDSYNSNDLSQNRGYRYTKKPNHEETVPTTDTSRVDEDTSLGNSLHSHLFPSQSSRVHSARLLIPIKRYGDYKETNQLPAVKEQSGLNGRSHFRSPSAPQGASLTRRNPSPEKKTSVPDFSQNHISVSNGEMLGLQKVQSYHFTDSLTRPNEVMGDGLEGTQMDAAKYEQTPFDERESRYGSGVKQPTRIKQGNVGPKRSFTKHQIRIYPSQHVATAPPEAHVHPAAVEEKNPEWFVPPVHLHSKDSYPSKTLVPSDQDVSTSRNLEQHHKPRQSVQRISRLRGFTNSVKESPLSERSQSSLNKGVDYGLKFATTYSYLNPKYRFGPKEPAPTTAPAEPKTTTGPPVPVIQVPPSPRPPTTRFKPTKVLKLETKDGVSRNSTQVRVLLYKGRFDLKGFGIQPLEGAKALPPGAEESIKPDFKGFKLRSLQTWRSRPIRIHRRQQASEFKSSTNNTTVGLSSIEAKPLPRTVRGNGSLPRPTSDSTTNKTQTVQILRPIEDETTPVQSKLSWRYSDQGLAKSPVISSSYLRPGGLLKAALKPETSEANKIKPVANKMVLFQTSTSSTVRGVRVTESSSRKLNRFLINATRNAAIIRRPGLKAVTYSDILGSASFSSVRAKSFPPAEEEYSPNRTTEQRGESNFKSDDGRNTSTSLERNDVTDQEDFQSVEKNKFGKGEETDNEVKMSGLFFDNEGSGSGDFDLSNVLSTVEENQAAGKDLLELDYLRKSTENVFFKSVRDPQLDEP